MGEDPGGGGGMMGKGAAAKEPGDLRPMSRTDVGIMLAVVVGATALVEFLGKGVIGISLILLLAAFCLLSVWAIGWAFVKLVVRLFRAGDRDSAVSSDVSPGPGGAPSETGGPESG
jgi:hypothetical protein